MSDIPTNVFHEILRRMPVDSLFRFRSVCKSWRRIIDNSDFTELHIHNGMGENTLLLRSNTGKVFLLPLTSLIYGSDDSWVTHVVAKNIENPVGPCVPSLPVPTCNGLLLISSSKKNSVWLIWNPFTSESIKVPPLDLDSTYCGLIWLWWAKWWL